MLIAVEGVSAAGKTTWSSHFAPAVIDELTGTAPTNGAEQIGEYWSERHAQRWQVGLSAETRYSIVCFDTDPLKLHYSWCLWQIHESDRDVWIATARATRRRIVLNEIGFVDQVVFLEPSLEVLRRQKEFDRTRRRRNFELNVRLYDPLRRWYLKLNELSPGRVNFNSSAPAVDVPNAIRQDRYDVKLFDAFIEALDHRDD